MGRRKAQAERAVSLQRRSYMYGDALTSIATTFEHFNPLGQSLSLRVSDAPSAHPEMMPSPVAWAKRPSNLVFDRR
eukprot:1291280-Pyramimonas_sp.AAC.1